VKKILFVVRLLRLKLATFILGEPIYTDVGQQIRHNIISSAMKIKWLTISGDHRTVCEVCKIICEEADKIK